MRIISTAIFTAILLVGILSVGGERIQAGDLEQTTNRSRMDSHQLKKIELPEVGYRTIGSNCTIESKSGISSPDSYCWGNWQ